MVSKRATRIRLALKRSTNSLEDSLRSLTQAPRTHARIILAATASNWCNHVGAVRTLSYSSTNASSARIVLRTLIEAWITCQYVLLDRTGIRARQYLLEHTRSQLVFYRRLRSMARRSPQERNRILKILGLRTLEDLEIRLDQLDAEAASLRTAHALEKRLRPLEQQAAAVSPNAELVYAQVYAFLFSEDVHMGPGGAVAPMLSRRASTIADIEKVLVTAEALTRDMSAIVEREITAE